MGDETKMCNCCGERPVWSVAVEHGHNYCEECSRGHVNCIEEGCEGEAEGCEFQWEIGRCESHARRHAMYELRDRLTDAICAAGFDLSGASEKSEAAYFSLPGHAMRVRVAAHDPSDRYPQCRECFCIGIGVSLGHCDVVLDENGSADFPRGHEAEDGVAVAVALAKAACLGSELTDNEDDDDA